MSFIVKTQFDGYSRDGRRSLNKGSSGSSPSAPYYANMDRLYGVQSQAAEYMLNNSMPYIPGYMENSAKMVNDAMDGTLSNQMRQRAGNEATATMGAALASSDRNMQRYGMGFSADRLLTESNRNAIMGAAGKAGAMNDAAARAEDMKWNRNAGALGQATGMGTGAMDSVGSAARGYGAAAGQVGQYDALNAAGYGKFGGALAANAFKDGGAVKKPGLHLATGGMPSNNPWTAWKNNNPIQTSSPSGGGGGLGDAVGAMAMGAAPIVIGKGLKAGLSSIKDAMTPAKDGMGTLSNISEAGRNKLTEQGLENAKNFWPTDPNTPVSAANTAAAEAGKDVATNVATEAGKDVATNVAGNVAADTATTAGTSAVLDAGANGGAALANIAAEGTAAAGAGTGATVASAALPVLGGAVALYGIGSALGWWDGFSKGGSVKRKNMQPGGKVVGKGTETSDDIPAWLSDGEYVLNAEAVKMVGKNKLDQINDAGLAKRGDKPGLELACGGKVGRKMAGGGFLGGNLGISLGAGVDEWNAQKRLGMAQSLTDLELKRYRPQLELQDDQIASGRSQHALSKAQNDAKLSMIDSQAHNERMQQNLTGISLAQRLLGSGLNKVMGGDVVGGIADMNQAAPEGAPTILSLSPAKGNTGINALMSDNSTQFIPTAIAQSAMAAVNPKTYESKHDNAGNFYSFDPSKGTHRLDVKGDPSNIKQHLPKEMLIAQDLVDSGKAKDRADAYTQMGFKKGMSKQQFILDYASKNGGTGGDLKVLSKQAGDLYDDVYGQSSTPASNTTGKSGKNWGDWGVPPQ